MKKFLALILILASSHSFALTYQEFVGANKKMKMYDQVLGVEFGKPIVSKKIADEGFSLEKKDPTSNIGFYKNERINHSFFTIKPLDVTYLAKDNKWISVMVEFEGEKNLTILKNNLIKKFGPPLLFNQNNEHLSYIWGASYTVDINNKKIKKLVRPLIVNFDFYEQMGVVIWTDPAIEFEQANKK